MDRDEHECPICTWEYQPTVRAMRTPCGHSVCKQCLRKLPPVAFKGPDGVKPCPFCRKEINKSDCEENLHLQEESNKTAASRLKYPFDYADCSACGMSAAFADLFVCYSCHPNLMQNVFTFQPEKMTKMFICVICEDKHRRIHPEGENPLSTFPVTIYTTENFSEIKELAIRVFRFYEIDNLAAPFAVGLIHSALARLEKPKLSDGLLHFLFDLSLGFLDYISEKTQWKDAREAARLFLKSYWPILKKLVDLPSPTFPGIDVVKPMMTAVERAAKTAFLVQDEERKDPSPYLARVAVEEYVWAKCSPILDSIWRQVLNIDTAQMGKQRTGAMMQLLSICRHVFENADTVDFLDEIVGNERQEIRKALALPTLSPTARDKLTEYEDQMEEEFELIDLQSAERHIKMDEAGRNYVVGNTS